MQSALPCRRNLLSIALGIVVILSGGAIGALAITSNVLAGTKTGMILAVGGIGGPLLIYLSTFAPLICPFGIYAVSVPFENLLDIPAYGTITKFIGLAAGAAILFYLLRTRRAIRPPKALWFWCALYLWAACTAFWALDPKPLFVMLGTSTSLVVLYGALSMLPADMKAVRWVAFCIVAGGVLAAAYGTYLAHSGADLFYGGRLRITTENSAIDPNHFAAALILPTTICVVTALYARKLITALLSLGAIAVLLSGISATESRGGILALAAVLVYIFIRSERRWTLALFAVPGGIAAGLVALNSQLAQRFQSAVSTGGAGREMIWKVGLDAFKQHWLLGAGYNNFAQAYDQVFMQSHQMGQVQWHHGSHDLIVGTVVELGIIGLALMLAAWVMQYRMLEFIPRGSPEFPMRLVAEASTIGLFLAALFLDVMVFKYVWLAFMLAVIVRSAYRTTHPRSELLRA